VRSLPIPNATSRRRLPAGCVAAATAAALLCAGLSSGCAPVPPAHDALALWKRVDAGCNRAEAHGADLSCDAAHHDAVLKDRCGATRFLLIPIQRRSGVESDELLQDGEPDYFADAWIARREVVRASGRPQAGDDEIGLAVNSRWGRSQDQLHIHIDFVSEPVREALRRWSRQGRTSGRIELSGHGYRVERIDSLRAPSPFQRAAAGLDASARGRLSIAVIGNGGSGFFLLTGRADLLGLDRGHAEELLVPKVCPR
jgi:CDP-diacylglycerol pyrophosphatase